MISVSIFRNSDQHILSFTMDGHADFAPHGQDLVCAAATAVSFGTINAIEKLCGYEPEVTTHEDGGFLKCNVPNNLDDSTYQRTQLLLEGMIVSLASIEEGYSEYIKLTEHEGGATNA
ncbi:ribosomal-processing cysteine protease Prp [Fictibacillus phosphorivorans]|uniref:ribosomal-processing cysteine protease Prp n=1 Tax=Fictibacillus phosphorivorans TaxID=1221500 RepID=UPI00204194EA|nr:ribosomal-processing cysteine protease Prp [Fictibacillus phosphorivorans]MCM3717003.1 ribosomal-processing cysteine protease Prp [Fictibacillus phosphorivorans]MCM3774448.1 ribosomal-processing cysteine protease Prp [Fictibacillus phosphorivorans]